jgi:hypothetical protein
MGLLRKYNILCFLMTMNLGVFAQNTPKFFLPKTTTDSVVIHFQNEIKKLKSQPEHFLQVFVETKNKVYESQFAIQGTYKVTKNSIAFIPDFPFMEGQNYIVRVIDFNDSEKTAYTNTSFFFPKKTKTVAANVTKVYPTNMELPENTFRFYIYFSTPMKQEVALQHIHLIDENGIEDKHAFMKFKSELWSPDGKRLTLLFDPGRIKRGVATNEEKGAALHSGKNYKLVISDTWTDVFDQPLDTTFTKPFEVLKAYRTEIEPKKWKISKLKKGTKKPLVIAFDRVFDHALLQHMILVLDKDNAVIKGKITVSKEERKWSFLPDSIWNDAPVFIQVDTRLEDIAGNNIQDLLDHTVQQGSKDISSIKLPIVLK